MSVCSLLLYSTHCWTVSTSTSTSMLNQFRYGFLHDQTLQKLVSAIELLLLLPVGVVVVVFCSTNRSNKEGKRHTQTKNPITLKFKLEPLFTLCVWVFISIDARGIHIPRLLKSSTHKHSLAQAVRQTTKKHTNDYETKSAHDSKRAGTYHIYFKNNIKVYPSAQSIRLYSHTLSYVREKVRYVFDIMQWCLLTR